MTAKPPLNPLAVRAADEQLRHRNPQLGNRRLTMSPEDAEYRRQWMAAYREALMELRPAPPTSGGRVGDPARCCPAPSLSDLNVSSFGS